MSHAPHAVNACTCGAVHPHLVMERRTFDGHAVRYCSDGRLTVGQTTYARGLDRQAADLLLGDIELYLRGEVLGLVAAARAAVAASCCSAAARKEMREKANPTEPFTRPGGVVPIIIFPARQARA